MQKTQDDLMAMEKGFWEHLDRPDFYSEHMAKDALAVIGNQVKTQAEAVAMTREMPVKWDNILFDHPRFVQISDDTAAVTYEGAAEQKTGERYAATITSVYAKRDGKWLLTLTTHTPNAEAVAKGKQPAVAASR